MMKRFFPLVMALCLTAIAYGQTEWPTDTVNGTPVYVYKVQKSEGLYRISKNFGVSQEELVRLNPQLQTQGLKYDQTIFVPIKGTAVQQAKPEVKAEAKAEAKAEQTEQKAEQKLEKAAAKAETTFREHVITEKETLYGLSKKYGVSVDELIAANPVVSKNMPIGATLLIPQKAPMKKLTDLPKIPVKIEAPAEKNTGKSELVLPDKTEEKIELQPTDTTALPEEKLQEEPGVSPIPLRIAYLLPLQADAIKRNATMDRFVDFYEGALLAIYEAQRSGQHFDIYTYDVQKADIAVQQVLTKGELQNMDAIIGPAYPAQVSYASAFAKQNRIPTLIPFTNKVNELERNPYLLQFNPTDALEAETAAHLLAPEKSNVKLIFVDAQAADVPEFVSTFHKAAADAQFSIGETTVREILNDSLALVLDKGKKNILVFNNSQYSQVSVLMNKIISQKKGADVALFGRYSWKNEKPAIPMCYISVFRDGEAAELTHYNTLYKEYFGHTLSANNPRYDLLGYDVTRALINYLLIAQQAQSEAEREAVYKETYRGLQSDIRFERTGKEGGLINTGIKLIWK